MLSYSTLRESLDIENLAADSEGLAYLTHYLQNSKNGVSQFFKPNAEEYLRHIQLPVSAVKDDGIQALLPLKWDIPFPPPEQPDFTFIDLFAGIGGIRIGFQQNGGVCVFSSEIGELPMI